MVLEGEAVDEKPGRDEDGAGPDCFQADFGGWIGAVEGVAGAFDDGVEDGAGGEFAEDATYGKGGTVCETDLERVPTETG